MFKLVVKPIDGIQDGLVYGTFVHCYTSKWQFKTTKVTSSVESPSHPGVLTLFSAGTCLREHSSQADIIQKIQGKTLGMSANA